MLLNKKFNFQIVQFTSLKQNTICLRMNRALINRICYDHAKSQLNRLPQTNILSCFKTLTLNAYKMTS